MTNRTRNHILDEISISFLRGVFPDSWVIHTFTRDNGIDIQVELFAENGQRTGIRFYGQVKATDNDIDDDVLSLDRSHFEYWSGHSDPVALIRYFDKTKTVCWCWLHDVDWLLNQGKKTVNVVGSLKVWDVNFSQMEIEKYLHDRRKALFEPFLPPYQISISNFQNTETNSSNLVTKISEKINSKSFRVLPSNVNAGHFQINIDNKKISCNFSGLSGFVFHYKNRISEEEFVDCILLAIFFCSCRYERILFARTFVNILIVSLYKSTKNDLRLIFLDLVIFSLGIKAAKNILLPVFSLESDSASAWFEFYEVCGQAAWKYGERYACIELLEEWNIRGAPFPNNAGSIAYSLGNLLSHEGRWNDASSAFEVALMKDKYYEGRSYFWVESGAAKFEAGDFKVAASLYSKALKLEHSIETEWRYADALFNSGEFESAHSILVNIIEREEMRENSYAFLIFLVCKDLLQVWHIRHQNIVHGLFKYDVNFENIECFVNETEAYKCILNMLKENALDAYLNFNLGFLASKSGFYKIAMYRYLSVALCQRNDGEAWRGAVSSAMNLKDMPTAILIMKVAHFYLDGAFIKWMLSIVPEPARAGNEWATLIAEITHSFEAAKLENTVNPVTRLHTSKGTTEIKFDLGND
jgi:tetratricopeptide (TPR) repeat protein